MFRFSVTVTVYQKSSDVIISYSLRTEVCSQRSKRTQSFLRRFLPPTLAASFLLRQKCRVIGPSFPPPPRPPPTLHFFLCFFFFFSFSPLPLNFLGRRTSPKTATRCFKVSHVSVSILALSWELRFKRVDS